MVEPSDETDSQEKAGGSIPGSPEGAAFFLLEREPSRIPVLIAAPHGGRGYSRGLLADLRHGLSAVLRLEDRHVDAVARDVAQVTGASLLVAHAPRAMVDLNRAPDDIDWDMFLRDARPPGGIAAPSRRARGGLGLVPRRLPIVGDLWRRRFSREDLVQRIEQVHEPYHATLSGVLARLRDRWGAALLIDLHSMPPLPVRAGIPRAQVVIGDRFGASCHDAIVAAAFEYLGQVGRPAVHNRPYAGGYVLERHAAPHAGIHALQIEIDRSRYLDSALVEPGEGMPGMNRDLAGLVRRLAGIVAELGAAELGRETSGQGWPLAAE
ncbi:N-formylglutamate amidohydrolase [Novosphingobium panipatense]|uniref:N-formylglutamate amidohydrolase n=1 Tax=Novosphingobium panipatense TaxID=428991 RepID=A0ABY1Q254_9SPHN|nr:N-formylglutamate amidohydrolase [Novosphingobium panipatense]SMP53581.1 N-formylglutamate amidohydrolase [Novosphingobium panipatense]